MGLKTRPRLVAELFGLAERRSFLHMLHTLWLRRKHPQERGHERRVLELESFFDCEYELRGLRGLGCACGFGLRGRHLIGTLSFGSPSCGPLLVQMSLPDIWYLEAVMLGLPILQATVLAALLVELATTAHEDQGEDKSDDDADDDADDASG